MRADVERVKVIVDSLAEEYADAYIKLDDLMHANEHYGEVHYFTKDGVHPNPTGAAFIAKLYVEAISPMIDEIIAK
jgi:lysophospholipase L1-like esterase